ncbi:MAG: ThiF family adenylyltransferase [Acidobacteria bacterium]|nr:ThiF family adenylyltransferase [Acidobacteriota bacterium]
MFRAELQKIRGLALQRAARALEDCGFQLHGGKWTGEITLNQARTIPLTVVLPPEFPDSLPNIYAEHEALIRRVPHIERDGKLCLAPSTGTLLDADNPEGIVRESLIRARGLLESGLNGELDEDFYREFLAYWGADVTFRSVCTPKGLPREICVTELRGDDERGAATSPTILLADSLQTAKDLAFRMGLIAERHSRGFFLGLEKPLFPPDFGQRLTCAEWLTQIKQNCSSASWKDFENWLRNVRLPLVLVLGMPLNNESGDVLIALMFGPARRNVAGFRRGKAPASLELKHTAQQAVTQVHLDRYDAGYLLPRGGAMEQISNKTVAVVGCGAIGSHLIQRLASLGVGLFRLVDKELLEADNLYRHALGLKYVRLNKAEGISREVSTCYPHVKAEFRHEDVVSVLENEPDFLLSADLILVALGDETLELRLNSLLANIRPRVHAWLEPLGIGGHVLVTAVSGGQGCFRCLFHNDEHHGLANRASFALPGQHFERSLAGCSGTFSPFSAIDADRTAIESARLAVEVLIGKRKDNVLVSWFGDSDQFRSQGFELSRRAVDFETGQCRYDTQFFNPVCSDCESAR